MSATASRVSRPDLGSFLDEVWPVLWERLDHALPDFAFERRGEAWVATHWPSTLDLAAEDKRPDRLVVYRDRPHYLKLHGHEGVRLLEVVAGEARPRGEVFVDACRRLATLAGVPFPERDPSPAAVARAIGLEERRRCLESTAAFCESALWSDHPTAAVARAFLTDERGFLENEIKALGLGIYLDRHALARRLESLGLERGAVSDSAVLVKDFEGYVTLPWRDAGGRVLTIYGRWHAKKPPEGRPKTYALPGKDTKGVPLYFDRARRAKADELVLVEGVFDAAILQSRGDARVVASVAAQLSGNQVDALKRYGVKRVIVCGDPDGGGDRGNVRNVHLLAQAGVGVLVAPRLPDGLDPDELVKRDGLGAWTAHVARATPGPRFLVEQVVGETTRESLDTERRAAADKALAALATVPATIDDGNAIAHLSARTGYPRRALETQLRSARAKHVKAPVEVETAGVARELPTIRMGRDLDVIVKAAEDALLLGDAGVYTRAGALVRLVRDERGTSIQPLPRAALMVLLSKHAAFVASKRLPDGSSVDVGTLPPRSVVEGLDEQGSWRFPALEAVVVAPTLRPDGSVLDTPGYDPETRLFYEPGIAFPPVPPNPTRAEARAALTLLHEPFREFPFKEDCDRSAALALALAVLGRGGYRGATPISVVRTPTPGTGKQLLTQIVGILALGRDPPTFAAPFADEEWSKKIGQHVKAGNRFTVIDECHRLDSRSLASAITLEFYDDRLLGTMDAVYGRLPIYASCGNNTLIAGDFGRRVVPIEIDSGQSRPEGRRFQRPEAVLRAWVHEHRARLVTAALTVLRAYVVDGRPDQGLTPMGSFAGWSELVRAALVWCGCADPVKGQSRLRQEADVGVDDTAALLQAWRKAFPLDAKLVARDLISCLGPHPELHELLLGLEKNPKHAGDRLNSRRLGYSLRQIKGRPVSGLVLRSAHDDATNTTAWWVEASKDESASVSSGDTNASPGISSASPVQLSSLFIKDLEESTGDAEMNPLHGSFSPPRAQPSDHDRSRARGQNEPGGPDHLRISGTFTQPSTPGAEACTGDALEMPEMISGGVFDPDAGDALEPPDFDD